MFHRQHFSSYQHDFVHLDENEPIINSTSPLSI
uniref:Uncharacterized protein n=1 Tax=Rhizophora mucronata TaxID=61149 RepID=A0A2P2NJ47_RHIMU